MKTLTVSFDLHSPLSANRQPTRACNVLFPAMEELILDSNAVGSCLVLDDQGSEVYIDCDASLDTESLSERMICGFAQLQKHASLSKITIGYINFGKNLDTNAVMMSNLEASLGGKNQSASAELIFEAQVLYKIKQPEFACRKLLISRLTTGVMMSERQ